MKRVSIALRIEGLVRTNARGQRRQGKGIKTQSEAQLLLGKISRKCKKAGLSQSKERLVVTFAR